MARTAPKIIPTGPGCGVGPDGEPQSFAAEMLAVDRSFLGCCCEDCDANQDDDAGTDDVFHAVLPVQR
jgi:hypothetical protein